MREYTFTEARQHFAAILEEAKKVKIAILESINQAELLISDL